MERWLTTVGAVLAMPTAIVGTTIAIENRYAKQLKLRILEIDSKPDPTPADRALRQYLMQELNQEAR